MKDNYETIEMPTTAGSIALASFHPARDAFSGPAAQGRRRGDSRQDEHARAGGGDHDRRLALRPDAGTPTTSIAIRAAPAAEPARRWRRISPSAGMGSDTCGSIRNPASHNDLVGLRGHAGAVEPHRHRAALDHAGHRRAARAKHRGSCRHARRDRWTRSGRRRRPRSSAGKIPSSYRAGLRADAIKGARIGVVRSLFGSAAEDQEVTTIVQSALDALKNAGAEDERRRDSRASTTCCATAR